ncbi:hypothetical protein [Niabella hirudinis]|uniref:hypothetical protein n=1 Tax=Niabella hirudinis TaxID=1285929 RepID=UPI003EBA4505
MPQRLSTILKVSAEQLDIKGVFNAFVDVDSKLYVDPSLLKNARIKEFKNSYSNFQTYFSHVLKLIENSRSHSDRLFKEAFQRLQFKEFKYVALGYSSGNKSGNAIGPKLASQLLLSATDIIKAGINDPIIFELIGLFEKNIGADRISDLTIHIIRKDLIAFTQRVCNELGVKQRNFSKTKSAQILLPYNPKTGEPIVFTAKELLQDLPLAFCWDDIDRVCMENDELRKKVNSQIGESWKEATSAKIGKQNLKAAILSNPDAFKDLIKQYNEKPKKSYDFINDPSGQIVWAELSEKAVNEFPLDLEKLQPVTSETILVVVKKICEQYAKLIESNGWFEFLYDNAGKLRNERFAQKLFYGIADQYCLANNLNLSRESNAGSGALDFKITGGYSSLVTIEIKYSSNKKLVNGYLKQLPAYNKAENADTSIYLVLKTTKSVNTIKRVEAIKQKAILNKKQVPDIIIIDATPQKSASAR